VSDKVVVIDTHQFNDNRISKQMSSVKHYPLLRLNFNFYPERKGVDGGDHAIVFDLVPTRNPYLNGLLFLAKVASGGLVRELMKRLQEDFLKDGDRLVFHVHDPYLLGLAVKLARHFPRNRVLYDRHEYYETWKGRSGISIPAYLERRYGGRVSEVIFVSKHHPPLPGPLSEKRVTVIPNYPPGESYPSVPVKDKIDSFHAGNVIAVYFGVLNLGFDRDVELMFEVMSLAMDSNLGLRFEVAGRIFDEGVRTIIDRMIERFGPRMSYLGEIPYDEVAKRTMVAHLGFFLLRTDSPMWSEERPVSPNKIYEFLLSGTVPVVRATLDDGEAVEKCSLHFGKDSNATNMAKAITELVNDQERMRGMMSRCRETGEGFTWERVSPLYGECYVRLFDSMK